MVINSFFHDTFRPIKQDFFFKLNLFNMQGLFFPGSRREKWGRGDRGGWFVYNTLTYFYRERI